jgi:site-specific recombinase XerD
LEIVEQKTRKKRQFTVPDQIYNFILEYAIAGGIKKDELLFPISARQVQKIIKYAADHMGLEGVGSHSFRKYASTQVYLKEKDIFLLKQLLQHASVSTTQRYINIDSKIEKVLEEHIKLPS